MILAPSANYQNYYSAVMEKFYAVKNRATLKSKDTSVLKTYQESPKTTVSQDKENQTPVTSAQFVNQY